MSLNEAVTRRDFVKTVGTAVGGTLLSDAAQGGTGVMREPRRYALVGTGDRGSSMWGRSVAATTFAGGIDYVKRGGSLWVHKATRHFDLVNWWLDADRVEVVARSDLRFYGRNGPFRHTHCRPCPRKADCTFSWDTTKDPRMVDIHVNAETADGYLRDGCVFRDDVKICDTMSALVTYSNGATMSYSLNAFMPIEGYRLAFNGTEGRLEIRDWERQPWIEPEEISIDLIFRRPGGVPPHLTLPGSRAGAMSCLTGIAARKSAEERRSIRIADLVAI